MTRKGEKCLRVLVPTVKLSHYLCSKLLCTVSQNYGPEKIGFKIKWQHYRHYFIQNERSIFYSSSEIWKCIYFKSAESIMCCYISKYPLQCRQTQSYLSTSLSHCTLYSFTQSVLHTSSLLPVKFCIAWMLKSEGLELSCWHQLSMTFNN